MTAASIIANLPGASCHEISWSCSFRSSLLRHLHRTDWTNQKPRSVRAPSLSRPISDSRVESFWRDHVTCLKVIPMDELSLTTDPIWSVDEPKVFPSAVKRKHSRPRRPPPPATCPSAREPLDWWQHPLLARMSASLPRSSARTGSCVKRKSIAGPFRMSPSCRQARLRLTSSRRDALIAPVYESAGARCRWCAHIWSDRRSVRRTRRFTGCAL